MAKGKLMILGTCDYIKKNFGEGIFYRNFNIPYIYIYINFIFIIKVIL